MGDYRQMKTYFLPLPKGPPVGYKCVQFNIPNEPQHIANFFGTLWQLTRWFAYQRDPNHGARAAADAWLTPWKEARASFDSQVCAMIEDFRQQGRLLQWTQDDGANWRTIYTDPDDIQDLSHFLIDNPSGSRTNLIIPQTGVYGILIKPENAYGITIFPQNPTNQPLIDLSTHGTGAALNLRGDGTGPKITTPGGTIVTSDNYLTMRVQSGDSEPPTDAAHRGVFYLFDQAPDTPYFIAKNGAAYVKRSLIGPAGADGATGAGITDAGITIGDPLDTPSVELTPTPDIQHQKIDFLLPRPPHVVQVNAQTAEPDVPASVELITRADGDLWESFVIPKGAKGDKGDKGDQGDPAPTPNPFDPYTLPDPGQTRAYEIQVPLWEGWIFPVLLPAGTHVNITADFGYWGASPDIAGITLDHPQLITDASGIILNPPSRVMELQWGFIKASDTSVTDFHNYTELKEASYEADAYLWFGCNSLDPLNPHTYGGIDLFLSLTAVDEPTPIAWCRPWHWQVGGPEVFETPVPLYQWPYVSNVTCHSDALDPDIFNDTHGGWSLFADEACTIQSQQVFEINATPTGLNTPNRPGVSWCAYFDATGSPGFISGSYPPNSYDGKWAGYYRSSTAFSIGITFREKI